MATSSSKARASPLRARSISGRPSTGGLHRFLRKGSGSRRVAREVVRLVGINHVALEVGDIDEALAWYGRVFELELRGRIGSQMAFVDLGDQFIALSHGRTQEPDGARHFGLVVDDKEAARAALIAAGVDVSRGRSLDFVDPWGNNVQVVD